MDSRRAPCKAEFFGKDPAFRWSLEAVQRQGGVLLVQQRVAEKSLDEPVQVRCRRIAAARW
jgi:hypothetical protein